MSPHAKISPRPAALLVATLLAALGPASLAHGDVDVSVGNGQKITGTLDPGDETETFRVNIPARARLSVTAKGKKQKGSKDVPRVGIEVFDEEGTDVAAGEIASSGSGSKLRGLTIVVSGEYRVVIAGNGTPGAYKAKIKWKAARTFQDTLQLAPGEPQGVTLDIDAGAVVSFKAAPSKGSPVQARLDRADHDGGTVHTFTPPTGGASSHTEKKVPFDTFGRHTVFLSDETGAGGGTTYKFKVKAPKGVKTPVDVTAKSIAVSDARGGVIGPMGGSVSLDDAPPGSSLEQLVGAGIEVEPGAVGKPTTFVYGRGADIIEIPGGDTRPAGPAVAFGPAGLSFDADVRVILPFDASRFDDPADVRVAVRDSRGRVSLVPAANITVDLVSGIVTVIVAHFSEYQVVQDRVPPVPGDLNADGVGDVIWNIEGDSVRVWFGGSANLTGARLDAPEALFTLAGLLTQFGDTVDTGDLNDDGVEDLVVGAWQGNGSGQVFVFFGGPSFGGTGDAAGLADVVLTTADGFNYGRTVAVGDIIGGPAPDLLVNTGVFSELPRIVIYEGGASFAPANAEDTDVEIIAKDVFQPFAESFRVGDVSGDGKADLVIGSAVSGSPPLDNRGGLRVFLGRVDFTSRSESQADISIDGNANDSMGSISALADFDNDGVLDILTTARLEVSGPLVRVYRGGAALTPGAAPFAQITGSGSFGQRIAFADLNNGGLADVLVGDFGSVFALAGSPTPVSTTSGSVPSRGTGGGFISIRDVTGDGNLDLILVENSGISIFAGPVLLTALSGLGATFRITSSP